MIRALIIILLLTGCASGPLSLLTGGGPNVAANVQAGKTNTQTIGETNITEQKIVRPTAGQITQTADQNQVRADGVTTQVNNFGLPFWAWLLIGTFIPSHREIAYNIRGWMKRDRAT